MARFDEMGNLISGDAKIISDSFSFSVASDSKSGAGDTKDTVLVEGHRTDGKSFDVKTVIKKLFPR